MEKTTTYNVSETDGIRVYSYNYTVSPSWIYGANHAEQTTVRKEVATNKFHVSYVGDIAPTEEIEIQKSAIDKIILDNGW